MLSDHDLAFRAGQDKSIEIIAEIIEQAFKDTHTPSLWDERIDSVCNRIVAMRTALRKAADTLALNQCTETLRVVREALGD